MHTMYHTAYIQIKPLINMIIHPLHKQLFSVRKYQYSTNKLVMNNIFSAE